MACCSWSCVFIHDWYARRWPREAVSPRRAETNFSSPASTVTSSPRLKKERASLRTIRRAARPGGTTPTVQAQKRRSQPELSPKIAAKSPRGTCAVTGSNAIAIMGTSRGQRSCEGRGRVRGQSGESRSISNHRFVIGRGRQRRFPGARQVAPLAKLWRSRGRAEATSKEAR